MPGTMDPQPQQHLPRTSFSFESLQFLPCPDEETFAQTWRNTHPEWGTAFSVDEWISIGKSMLHSPVASSFPPGFYELFIVTSKDDPDQNVLSSCAIHVVDAMVGYRSSKNSMKEEQVEHNTSGNNTSGDSHVHVRDVKCATAVRVVTPVPYRGYGYGGWMMKQLWQYLEQRPDIQLSNLYSDVGDYYTRKGGWKWFRSDIIRLSVAEFTTNVTDLPPVEQISDERLDEVVEWDASLARSEIEDMCRNINNNSSLTERTTVAVAIRPDSRVVRWQRMRKEYDLALVKRQGILDESVQLGAHGAKVRSSSSLRHILWCQDVVDKRFRIHRFRHGLNVDSSQDRAEAMALLQAAVDDAKRLKVTIIEIWNPHPSLEAWLGQKGVDRKIPLSNLGFCLGPDASSFEVVEDGENRIPTPNIEWIHNEFYPCL